MVEKDKSIVFLSYLQSDYSRSGVYFDGLREDFADYVSIRTALFSAVIDLWRLRRSINLENKSILVMSPSHKITILARAVLRKEIILDAGWALSEASIGPKKAGPRTLRIVKNFVVDFLSFHSANKTILESQQEVDYISKRFLIPKKKLRFVYTGLNESKFQKNQVKDNAFDKMRLQVLFRGKKNDEAGISNILNATLILENEPIDFIILTNKDLSEFKSSKNTKIISSYLTNDEITDFYLRSDVCLGQFSEHKRLERTIPHKAFESLYFSRCYLTPRTSPLESMCVTLKEIFFTNSAKPEDLAKSLLLLEKNRDLIRETATSGHALYRSSLRQAHLAELVKGICFEETD